MNNWEKLKEWAEERYRFFSEVNLYSSDWRHAKLVLKKIEEIESGCEVE
jgi:hypothetical protein